MVDARGGTGKGAKDTDLTSGACVEGVVVVTLDRADSEVVGKANEERLVEVADGGTPWEAPEAV